MPTATLCRLPRWTWARWQQQNALPDSVAGGFSLFVQAFQEAPLAQVSDAPVLAAMNTATEQYNKIDACGIGLE